MPESIIFAATSLRMRSIHTLLLLLLIIILPSCHIHRMASKMEPDNDRIEHRRGEIEHKRGEHKYTTEEYIALYKDAAIHQMRKYGIPASITLAQGILESSNGNSPLARDANNHFGIKCHDWNGKTYYYDDDKPNECFRRYSSAEASYKDHAEFLKARRYASLFDLRRDDYKGWAKGLKKAGYATNPKYPQLLINLIERYNLDKYD